ncbi:MAG: hypothetical protein L6R39_003477, partial [Caloplaca ligustica]
MAFASLEDEDDISCESSFSNRPLKYLDSNPRLPASRPVDFSHLIDVEPVFNENTDPVNLRLCDGVVTVLSKYDENLLSRFLNLDVPEVFFLREEHKAHLEDMFGFYNRRGNTVEYGERVFSKIHDDGRWETTSADGAAMQLMPKSIPPVELTKFGMRMAQSMLVGEKWSTQKPVKIQTSKPEWLAQWEGQSRKYYYVQRATGHSQWDIPTQPALSVPTPDPTPQPINDPFGKPAMSSERGPSDQGENYEGADRGFISDLATNAIPGKHNKPHQSQSGLGGLATSLLGGQGSHGGGAHGGGGHGGGGGLAGQLIGGILGGGKPHSQQHAQHSSASGGYGNPAGGHQPGGLGSFFGGHHGTSVGPHNTAFHVLPTLTKASRTRATISDTAAEATVPAAAVSTPAKPLLQHTNPHLSNRQA